jgi:hypothetical protein
MVIARADRRPAEFGALFKFHEVFQKEIALINQRRAGDPRGEIQLQIEALEDVSGEPVLAPPENANVVGLSNRIQIRPLFACKSDPF